MTLTSLTRSASMVYRTLIKRETPVIVYTPGRVGSISVINAIRNAGLLGYKVESFSQEKLSSVHFAKRYIIDAGRPATIISLVRDPIEILISLYFSKLKHLPPVDTSDYAATEAHFITHMLENTRYHDQYLRWFETEFEPNMGYSVFDHSFSAEEKFTVIEYERFPTLILRTDLPNEEKSAQVTDFLNTDVTIGTTNVKTKDPDYVQFKQNVILPENHIKMIYQLPYSQHFFTETERAAMFDRWTS